jgi:hypothetical protein
MIEELPPYLISVIFIVSEVAVPSGLSSKIRPKIESIVLDFNKTLRSCQKNIEDISLFLPKQHEFFRFIDAGVLISSEFATVNRSCDSAIQEKASSCILELSALRTQALTKKDSEGIDLLIAKLGEAPENVFFVEVQQNHIAAGELIGKTIQKLNLN